MRDSSHHQRLLLDFLEDWLAWATSGDSDLPSPLGVCYDNRNGLCHAASLFSDSVPGARQWNQVLGFGGTAYPFGEGDYDDRRISRSQHLCPKRRAWVRKTIARLEAGNAD